MTFTIVQNGIKCKYLCYKGAEGVEHELSSEESTDEQNGVTFEMSIKDYYEYSNFKDKAIQKLTYYDTVVLIIDGTPFENKVYRNELFQYAEYRPYEEMHLCLKDVVYTIDWNKLGLNSRIQIPVALRFDLDSGLTPTPSRENLLYTGATIRLIKERISDVATWFFTKYNESIKTFDNIYDAWNNIDCYDKYISLGKEHHHVFHINHLFGHTEVKLLEPTVEGIVLKPLKYYKQLKTALLEEYKEVAFHNYKSWKKKRLYNDFYRNFNVDEINLVHYDGNLAGNVKRFLIEKYREGTVYVTKSKSYSLKNYRAILYLKNNEKETWRKQIQEFQLVQKQLFDKRLNDENGVETTKEFLEWVENKKTERRERIRENKTSIEYKGLNKQQGEITISKIRASKRGGGVVIDKSTMSINELHKLKQLWVHCNGEEELPYFVRVFENVNFTYLNKREIKHIENLKGWKTMEEFKASKPFSRLYTVLEIESLEKCTPENEELIYEAFPKYLQLKEKIAKYKLTNDFDDRYIDSESEKNIIKFARENNLFDGNIWSEIKEFKQILKDFSFLKYLDIDDLNNKGDDEMKVLKNMVYIILKSKKISCKFVEDYELVEKVPVEVYEQMEEQFQTA